jgi:hypothetical protein
MTTASFTLTAARGPTATSTEADTQAAKEAVAALVENATQQNEALAVDAATVAELAPPIEETPPDEPEDEATNDECSPEVEPVVSEKLKCLPQPGDVLWISASCMEALKPFSSALRVRVLKVRDLHEKPLRLSEYHAYWWTTPFDRIQIVGEVVSEGWKKGNRYTFWIPGPHQAESPTLSVVEWPIEDGQIKQFGPEFDSCEYSRCTLIMAARMLLQQGNGSLYRIMPAVPHEAAEGGAA